MAEHVKLDWKSIRQKAGPYSHEALQFVRDGLAHAVKTLHGESGGAGGSSNDRHVNGQQLCLGLRDYAIERYGMLARTVLARWGVNRTEDFGRIVFAMIDAGLLRRSEEDSPEAFRGVYDFDEAFAVAETV
ncbi:MAG: Minf_1886 family protein [Phycisphaerales bacterium]